jgi:dTDP-4-dehydrorhamnose reductase
MRVLITGSAGMLASDLIPCLSEKGYEVIAPPESELDICNLEVLRNVAHSVEPEILINCAAYTAVDDAETDESRALIINGYAVQNLCLICQEGDIPLVHFSTDYVFDGEKDSPYFIYDHPNPLSAYGRTKLLGEKYVLWLLEKFYLVRTA